jgi:hypothetical protein
MHEVCKSGMQFLHLFVPAGFESCGPHENASPRSQVLLKMRGKRGNRIGERAREKLRAPATNLAAAL